MIKRHNEIKEKYVTIHQAMDWHLIQVGLSHLRKMSSPNTSQKTHILQNSFFSLSFHGKRSKLCTHISDLQYLIKAFFLSSPFMAITHPIIPHSLYQYLQYIVLQKMIYTLYTVCNYLLLFFFLKP